MRIVLTIIGLLLMPVSSSAGEADVVGVRADHDGGRSYTFYVTLRHGDTGWDHYADKWDVVAPDGKVLGTRVLYHPHMEEQPFTRSLSGIRIPEGVTGVTVRAHDKVHAYGGKVFEVPIPSR